ncbi:Uu.00g134260.m01.CDS01 [Anthostomella pinea]|uniref:Uu.00g134260.m01.CDS01 n=1 Tax=Anthostomella pinea TaxID=933095 RepID=A0AAI8YKS4_9PEZI|nr:Uu.00g134260.m01.CDS01 [Anthostomella pinea]
MLCIPSLSRSTPFSRPIVCPWCHHSSGAALSARISSASAQSVSRSASVWHPLEADIEIVEDGTTQDGDEGEDERQSRRRLRVVAKTALPTPVVLVMLLVVDTGIGWQVVDTSRKRKDGWRDVRSENGRKAGFRGLEDLEHPMSAINISARNENE